MHELMRNVMNSHEVGKRELCETNVIPIPSPGLGRLRVCGLASQTVANCYCIEQLSHIN